LGNRLGLPLDLVWRQPFPGPGLAVRIICAEEPSIDSLFEKTNKILNGILRKEIEAPQLAGIDFSNIYATILPIKTVGVQGDSRSYQYVAALTGERNWSKLFLLARTIPQICHNINRIVYVFGNVISEPVTQITPTFLTKDVVKTLQEADYIVNCFLAEHKLMRSLSQVPVIIFPVNFGLIGCRSIAIRPFITSDFMTGIAAQPGKDLPEEPLIKIVEKNTKN